MEDKIIKLARATEEANKALVEAIGEDTNKRIDDLEKNLDESLSSFEEDLEKELIIVDEKLAKQDKKLTEFDSKIKVLKDGKTPVKGVDYFTPKDVAEVTKKVVELIPPHECDMEEELFVKKEDHIDGSLVDDIEKYIQPIKIKGLSEAVDATKIKNIYEAIDGSKIKNLPIATLKQGGKSSIIGFSGGSGSGSGGGTWGSITGTLSNQTDLQNALNAKLSITTAASTYVPYTGATGAVNLGAYDLSVADEVYGVAWNGSLEVPTKNAVYDKVEAIIATIPSVPGSNTQIIFNDGGAFGADSNFVWDKTANAMTVTGGTGRSQFSRGLLINASQDGSVTGVFQVKSTGDANLIYTDSALDRVGIGTATPAYKFDVVGTAGVSGIFHNGNIRATGSGGILFESNSGADVALFGAGGGQGATFYDGVILSTMTQGSVLFAGASGLISQDNANFFWDDTNNRLGLGMTSPTARLSLTGESLTGSTATSAFDTIQTWNTSGTPTAWKLNITDTASNAASLLMDLQVGGASKFKVSKAGAVTALTFNPTTKQTYTESNVTTDRSYDANATTIDELADVLGTLIADLRAAGLIS